MDATRKIIVNDAAEKYYRDSVDDPAMVEVLFFPRAEGRSTATRQVVHASAEAPNDTITVAFTDARQAAISGPPSKVILLVPSTVGAGAFMDYGYQGVTHITSKCEQRAFQPKLKPREFCPPNYYSLHFNGVSICTHSLRCVQIDTQLDCREHCSCRPRGSAKEAGWETGGPESSLLCWELAKLYTGICGFTTRAVNYHAIYVDVLWEKYNNR